MTPAEVHYQQLVFSHANLKQPVHVVAGTISFYFYSPAIQAVTIYTTGGGILPVVETMEEVANKINRLTEPRGEK